MQILNNLYILDHRAMVSTSKGSLELKIDRQLKARYPLDGLDQVIIVGNGQITTSAMTRCVEHGVAVAVLSGSGRLRFTVSPARSGNVHLRVAQHHHSNSVDHSLTIAADIVAGKLQNQRRMIRRWASDHTGSQRDQLENIREQIAERIAKLYDPPNHDVVRGLEGDATRLYFKALAVHLETTQSPINFIRRSRRPPADPLNALLSFLYTLLTAECAGALEAIGLDPQIGFLHGIRSGRPSLALDIVEEFRVPFADRVAVAMLKRRHLTLGDFEQTNNTAWSLSDTGRRKVLEHLSQRRQNTIEHPLLQRELPRATFPLTQATLLARHIRGDIDRYPPYVMAV